MMLTSTQLERAHGLMDLSRQTCDELTAVLGEVLEMPALTEPSFQVNPVFVRNEPWRLDDRT